MGYESAMGLYPNPETRDPKPDLEPLNPKRRPQVYYMGYESAMGLGGAQSTNSSVLAKEVEGLTGVSDLAFGSIHGLAIVRSSLFIGGSAK